MVFCQISPLSCRLKLSHDYIHLCQQYGQQEKSHKMVRILFGLLVSKHATDQTATQDSKL